VNLCPRLDFAVILLNDDASRAQLGFTWSVTTLRVTLSDDERRTILLSLAHLAHFLPEADRELRRIAGKLNANDLYDRFKNLESAPQCREEVPVSVRRA
jgi:hypothetical protein